MVGAESEAHARELSRSLFDAFVISTCPSFHVASVESDVTGSKWSPMEVGSSVAINERE